MVLGLGILSLFSISQPIPSGQDTCRIARRICANLYILAPAEVKAATLTVAPAVVVTAAVVVTVVAVEVVAVVVTAVAAATAAAVVVVTAAVLPVVTA